ncbi:MAG: FtsX-like permease family protein, partial [bacterium]|nr:FtsX-like permease family protein [bacterium]
MPPEFTFPDNSEIWFPLRERELPDHRNHFLRVIGRRTPGVSLAEARSEMDTIAARLDNPPVTGVIIVPLQEQIVGDNQRALVILLAAVACVLLIACANVTNLLLIRAKRRQREIALRLALGAGRWRVVRSLLMESLLLALTGGAAGVAWAYWSVELFVAFDPLRLPRIEEIAVDPTVLLFTFVVAMATGVLFGLAPALRVSRPDLNEALKEGSERRSLAGGGRSRVRGALAVVQIALAVVLLTSTGLLLRSFVNRISVPLGFRPDGVLGVELPWGAHRRIDEILERVRSVPGVESAGSGTAFPHRAPGTSGRFSVEGNAEEGMEAGRISVTPGYFRAAGMALRKGRLPTAADGPDAGKVAVVNEALVRQFFAGQDPIGRNVTTTDGEVLRRVIGIVADVKGFGVDGAPMPTIYIPYRQVSWGNSVHLLVRAAAPPASVASAVRKEIRGFNGRWVIGMDTVEGLLA